MELEEAEIVIERLIEEFKFIQDTLDEDEKEIYAETIGVQEIQAIETVLKALENSVSKDVIREKINERQFELQQEYKDFKDDIRLNTLQELYYYKEKE